MRNIELCPTNGKAWLNVMKETVNVGFPPEIHSDSRVLILGSFPSVKSRLVGFYYGNPQNRFWKTLEKATGKPVPKDIDGKKAFLKENKIALWDVIDSSSIVGSSDSDINSQNSKAVDLESVLDISHDLRVIICNGKKAYSVFCEILPNPPIKCIYLSSTSSANPTFDMNRWVEILGKFL